MGGNFFGGAFGNQLGKGFQQLQQQGQQPGKQHAMIMPEFHYTPDKGLQVNLSNDMLQAFMQPQAQAGPRPQMMPPGAMPMSMPTNPPTA